MSSATKRDHLPHEIQISYCPRASRRACPRRASPLISDRACTRRSIVYQIRCSGGQLHADRTCLLSGNLIDASDVSPHVSGMLRHGDQCDADLGHACWDMLGAIAIGMSPLSGCLGCVTQSGLACRRWAPTSTSNSRSDFEPEVQAFPGSPVPSDPPDPLASMGHCQTAKLT